MSTRYLLDPDMFNPAAPYCLPQQLLEAARVCEGVEVIDRGAFISFTAEGAENIAAKIMHDNKNEENLPFTLTGEVLVKLCAFRK